MGHPDTHKTTCEPRVIHSDRVVNAQVGALPREHLEALSSLFKALGDPTRLQLVMAMRDGEMCVCDLAATLGLSESAISHQLRRLRELSLVRTRREGQVVYYALDDEHVAQLLSVGLIHVVE